MENLIKKSEKFIIGGLYAVYLIAITVFMTIWVDGVEIRLELWSESATKILTFVIYYSIVIIGFVFFTAVQQLVHSLTAKYPARKNVTVLTYVLLAVLEAIKIALSAGGFIFTLSYNDKFMQPFSTYIFILLGLIFIIDVFYLVFEIVQAKKIEPNPKNDAVDLNVFDSDETGGKIKKSKKLITRGLYAIYLIMLLVFTAKWSVGVHSHISMDEVSNAIFVFVLHFLLLGGAFIFFTVMQALIHRLITARPHQRAITCPVFVLLAFFEVVKIALSILAFIYVKSSPTKPMTPFSTIMIIVLSIIFLTDVFYLAVEIIQIKKKREDFLDSLEETVV